MCTDKVKEFKDTKHLLEYLKELLTDRINLLASSDLYIHVLRILEKEILNVRSELFSAFGIYQITEEELPAPEGRKVNLQAKVYMPTGTSNNYNFVGRILGPDGSTAKCLQQFLGVRIMIRGRGSMRDQTKEEANIGRPNWEHLNDNLHVLITVEDYENRAKARIEKASEYISLFLEESVKVSDKDDKVKLMQSMELSVMRKALQQGQQQSSGIIIPTSHQSLLPSFNGFTQYPQQNHTPSFQSSGASDLSSTTLYLQNNGTGGQGGVGSSGLGVGTDAASFNGTFSFTNSFRSNYQPTYSQSGQSSTTLGVSVVPPVGINYWPGNYSSQNYPIPQSQCYQNVTTAVINANSHNNNNNGSHSYQHQFQKQQYRIPEKYLSDKWISSQKLMNNNSIPSQSSYTTPLMISTQHHQHLQQQHQQCDYCRQLLDDQLSTVNNLSRYTLNNKHNYPMAKATSVVHTKSSIITNVRSNSDSCMNRTHNSNNNPPSEYDKKLQKYPIKSPVRRQVHGNELNNKGGSTNSNNTNKSFNSICPTKQPTNSVDSKRRYSQRHNNNNSNNGSNLNHTEANNDLNSNESVGNHNNSTKTGGRPHQAQNDSVVVSKISNKENNNNNNNNSSGSPGESYRHAAANVNPSCSPLTEGTVSVTTAATSTTATTTTVIPDHSNVDQIVTVDENNNKHESASSSSISSSSCKNSQQSNNNNTKPSDTSVKSVALVIDETEWPKLETAVNTRNTRKSTSFTVARKTFKRSSMLNADRQQTKKL